MGLYTLLTTFLKKFKPETLCNLPSNVQLEACTLCQLNCPSCYMRLYDSCGRGRGYLKFSDFKKFVDQHRFIKKIEISNNGEIFLNPELYKILEYAYKKKIRLSAAVGVNFNTVSDQIIEAPIDYKNPCASCPQSIYAFRARHNDFIQIDKTSCKAEA